MKLDAELAVSHTIGIPANEVDFLVPFAGGLPIRTQNGDLLGAIGVSGATGDQDEECAQAALDAIKEDLK